MLIAFLQFETMEWSLEPEGGQKFSLMDAEGKDPMSNR